MDLAGQIAVVTGSSSGIGRAIALELAAAGAAVLVHGRRPEAIQAAVEEIQSHGGVAEGIAADLQQVSEQDALVDRAWRWRSAVDIWIHNVGADVLTGPGARSSFEEKLDALWRVDVAATMRVARLAGARMKAAGRGAMVTVGWDGAARGMEGDSGQLFAAAKGAVMAFTLSLAQSLAPQVRVNCVAPGWIKTAWGQQASGKWQERARGESLLDRWGTPEDVARAVRFLASPQAAFITGQILAVNGGYRTSRKDA